VKVSRRSFVKGAAAGTLGPAIIGAQSGALPVAIASANGLRAVRRAYDLMKSGADTLDAVLAGVNINEDDPEDNSVGYGGLPNEDGVVELDASVMHGPTGRAGAVAALRDIRFPSRVAQLVMKRTDHLLLVGEGALRFALAHGFKREDLLTEKSRIAWLAWKETMSDKDGWGPGLSAQEEENKVKSFLEEVGRPDLFDWVLALIRHRPYGTICCLGLNEKRDMSGAVTTSGLAWKMAGRVGDSPLIGAGLFVDNAVGAAGSTGRGEEAIRISGAHTVVEAMRSGATPREACLEAIRRVASNYKSDKSKLSQFNIIFYAINKRGEHGAASLWSGAWRIDRFSRAQYAVADPQGVRLLEAAYLYERTP
jgi:N4-(beta-N-acetylglucosaminyl)-L-asparaginase